MSDRTSEFRPRSSTDDRTDADRSTGGPVPAPETDEPTAGAGGASPEGDVRSRPSEPNPDASRLVGESLEIGYPATEGPVADVDRIDLPAGEVTTLVGPNGSGKSTLLKALARQLEPDAGAVYLDGNDVETFGNKAFARRVGLLSQEHESPGSLGVEELIYYGRYPHRGFFDAVDDEDRAAVERAIELAGVDHLRDEDVSNLSGGQKQLVWIAMVLAQETDVLLLDEPTTYLDLHHQLRVLEVLETLNEDRSVTVGIVLHDIAQAARYADNLIALKDGQVYDWGPPDEVVTEALLEDVFGVAAAVGFDADGPIIRPRHPIEDD